MLLTLPIAFAFGTLSVYPCEKVATGTRPAQRVAMCSAAPRPAECASVGSPSTAIFAAQDGQGGVDGPYSLMMIGLFRLAFGMCIHVHNAYMSDDERAAPRLG